MPSGLQGTPLRWLDGNPVVFSAWSGQRTRREHSKEQVASDQQKTEVKTQSYLQEGHFGTMTMQTLHIMSKGNNVSRCTDKQTYPAKDKIYGVPSWDGGQDRKSVV